MTKRNTLALMLALVAASHYAAAAPLNVSETTDYVGVGEQQSPNTFVGVLDVGINTISGNISGADVDTVRATLPAGLTVTELLITLVNHTDASFGNTEFIALTYTPFSSPFAFLDNQGDTDLISGTFANPGDYILGVEHNGAITGSSSDWQWQITVIPEPTSLVLLGLGGLALLARRPAQYQHED